MTRKKENRPEAADYGRSNPRNQRRIDFLRSTGVGADRGPYGSGKEAIREAQNRGRGYRGVADQLVSRVLWESCQDPAGHLLK